MGGIAILHYSLFVFVQETIAQLSSKVESLKIKLQRALPTDTANREGMIMFTRLDSERNAKALETALERERYVAAITYLIWEFKLLFFFLMQDYTCHFHSPHKQHG